MMGHFAIPKLNGTMVAVICAQVQTQTARLIPLKAQRNTQVRYRVIMKPVSGFTPLRRVLHLYVCPTSTCSAQVYYKITTCGVPMCFNKDGTLHTCQSPTLHEMLELILVR